MNCFLPAAHPQQDIVFNQYKFYESQNSAIFLKVISHRHSAEGGAHSEA
jgi:hypothetical protein